jgi:hypothetical protein
MVFWSNLFFVGASSADFWRAWWTLIAVSLITTSSHLTPRFPQYGPADKRFWSCKFLQTLILWVEVFRSCKLCTFLGLRLEWDGGQILCFAGACGTVGWRGTFQISATSHPWQCWTWVTTTSMAPSPIQLHTLRTSPTCRSLQLEVDLSERFSFMSTMKCQILIHHLNNTWVIYTCRDLSNNQLTGQIPGAIGNLQDMSAL